jgi:hypothetical protein
MAGQQVETGDSLGSCGEWNGLVKWTTMSGRASWRRGAEMPLSAAFTWSRGEQEKRMIEHASCPG